MSNKVVVGYCLYCKQEIYADEAFVKSNGNSYHASETEDHDNCWLYIFSELEGEE